MKKTVWTGTSGGQESRKSAKVEFGNWKFGGRFSKPVHPTTVGHDLGIWSKIDVFQLYSFCFILKLETILKKMSYHKAL